MNSIRNLPIFRAAVNGLLSAAFFAASWTAIGGFWPLIFISFIPLFFVSKDIDVELITIKQGFLIFVFTFFCWNISTLYFVSFVEANWFIRIVAQLVPVGINTVLMSTVFILHHRFKVSLLKWHWLMLIVLWLSMEWFQHHWAMAFPWLSLGNVFASSPSFIQWYEFTGTSGGSFWVLLINVLIFKFIEITENSGKLKLLTAVLALIALPIALSLWLFNQNEPLKDKIQAVVVQPCLSNSEEKFELELQQESLFNMLNLAQKANENADLIVFPETSIFEPGQFLFKNDSLVFQGVWLHETKNSFTENILKDYQNTFNQPSIITGVFASEYYPPGLEAPSFADYIEQLDANVLYYNSALIVSADSTVFSHKSMLVPGVETIPMASFLPFLNEISVNFGGIVGSLGKEDKPKSVLVKPGVRAAILICYDSAFGWLSTEVADDANLIVIITNDSWWGNTPGHKQLLSFSQLRAIESRKPILRSANNGISAIISAKGEITHFLPWDEVGALAASVSINPTKTFYTQFGDLIYKVAGILLGLTFLYLIYLRIVGPKQ